MVLTILHTNDFHNKLTAHEANALTRLKEEAGPCALLLDAGDAVSAGNVGVRIGGEPILELMSDAGYDAMTAGNREFHIVDGVFRYKIGRAAFPVLCANIAGKHESKAVSMVKPSHTWKLGGLVVSVFGLTVPMVTERMKAKYVSDFLFGDPIEAARKQIELLRADASILIALTHIGIREDQRLAASCPEVDLIVGGHSHEVLRSAITAFGVPIVQAGWFAHYVGRVLIDSVEGRPSLRASELLPLKSLVSR